jgi:SAM-dependent methyltransferase
MRAAPACPVCAASAPEIMRRFTIDLVATHFIPASRDLRRHTELRELLGDLWEGRDTVAIRRCSSCSLGFADPWVAGTDRFYNLVTESDPHYPRDRWEFRRTIRCLTARPPTVGHQIPARILEVGAGSGAFLKQLRSSSVGTEFSPLAIEYDRGAVAKLEQAGFETSRDSLQELAGTAQRKGIFTAICMFQTLEHIADVHGVFGAVKTLLRHDGDLFISVPFGPSTELQEELTGYWDMPPNHVGRWTRSAFDSIAEQHAFRLVEWELERTARLLLAWRLASYAVRAKAYDEDSVAGRINALRIRSIRGPAKRILAVALMPKMLVAWHRLCAPTQWVHMKPTARGDQAKADGRSSNLSS